MSELTAGRANGEADGRANGHPSPAEDPTVRWNGAANGHAPGRRRGNGSGVGDGEPGNGSRIGDGEPGTSPPVNGHASGRPSRNGSTTVEATPGERAESITLTAQVEAVLFVADVPVAVADLARALDVRPAAIERALAELARSYDDRRGIRLQKASGQVQLVSAPEAAGAIGRFLGLEQSTRLSRAALETLSIIAYRQPVTRPEIDALRGVDSDGVMRSLLARGLVEPVGRRTTVGHPVEYGTTFLFLEYFGLTGLADLPPIAAAADEHPIDLLPLFAPASDLAAAGPSAEAPVTPSAAAPAGEPVEGPSGPPSESPSESLAGPSADAPAPPSAEAPAGSPSESLAAATAAPPGDSAADA
jgi:segregation and condensation protein B